MDCRRTGDKPSLESMVIYRHLDTREQTKNLNPNRHINCQENTLVAGEMAAILSQPRGVHFTGLTNSKSSYCCLCPHVFIFHIFCTIHHKYPNAIWLVIDFHEQQFSTISLRFLTSISLSLSDVCNFHVCLIFTLHIEIDIWLTLSCRRQISNFQINISLKTFAFGF